MPSPVSLAALSALPLGSVAALLTNHALYAFLLGLAGLVPVLANTCMRWQTHRMWLELERRRLRALDRLEAPEQILDRLPPPTGPLGLTPPTQGPAPPAASPSDPAAGGAAGAG